VLAAVQLAYGPVLLLVYGLQPLWLPFVMAVLFGSHFLPYGWLYRSRGYYFLGIAVPLVATALRVMGVDLSYAYTAPVVAVVYGVGVVQVLREVHDLTGAPPAAQPMST
jgi:hypothetical protein